MYLLFIREIKSMLPTYSRKVPSITFTTLPPFGPTQTTMRHVGPWSSVGVARTWRSLLGIVSEVHDAIRSRKRQQCQLINHNMCK